MGNVWPLLEALATCRKAMSIITSTFLNLICSFLANM